MKALRSAVVGCVSALCLLAGQSAAPKAKAPKPPRSSAARGQRASTPAPAPPPLEPVSAGSASIRLSADRQWVDAGVNVVPGMLIDISATGQIVLEDGERTGPEGLLGEKGIGPFVPAPNAARGAVIVKVSYPDGFDSNVLPVGRGLQFRVEEHESGHLFVGINTAPGEKASGEFTATLRWR